MAKQSIPGIPATIEAYIAMAGPKAKPILRKIQKLIVEVVPEAKPTISYRMPAFRCRRVFIFFAAFKEHIGIYPPLGSSSDQAFAKALEPYRGPKGNLKFPLDQPMPYELIRKVIVELNRQAG